MGTNGKIEDHGGKTLIQVAESMGNSQIRDLIVFRDVCSRMPARREGDFIMEDMMPLQAAVRREDVELVEVLISNGADPNIAGKFNLKATQCKTNHDIQDKNCTTPLRAAVFVDNIDILRLFIAHGADLNIAGECSPTTTRCDTNDKIEDQWGRTPLHLAVIEQKSEVVKLLSANGADLNLAGECSLSPAQYGTNGNINRQ